MGQDNRHGVIYGLCDPRYDNLVRYVGQTVVPLAKRFRVHLREARLNTYESHKDRWIRKLLSAGLKPSPIVLLRVREDELDAEETALIAAFREECVICGHHLTNGTDGGEGTRGRVASEETRGKMRTAMLGPANHIRGKHLSEETKATLRTMFSREGNPFYGRKHSEATRAKLREHHKGMEGQHHTPEAIAKMSATKKGKVFSEEHKQHIRDSWVRSGASRRGWHHSPESVEKMRFKNLGRKRTMAMRLRLSLAHMKITIDVVRQILQRLEDGALQHDIAGEFNVQQSTVSRIKTGARGFYKQMVEAAA